MNSDQQIAGTGQNWTALFSGDSTLVLEFGKRIDRFVVDQIKALDTLINLAVEAGELSGVRETIPTFRSLAIIYDSATVHPTVLIDSIQKLESDSELTPNQAVSSRQWHLPVLYGTQEGPDLDDVAQLTGLSPERVIELHSTCTYSVYMLGFLPGYAFLGDTPQQLHLPRRSEPRLRVPSGSVAIAMQLTGIYPWDSPGGWHILGNCPVPLFNAQLSPPALLKAGDSVSFYQIDTQQFEQLKSEFRHETPAHERWLSGNG